MFISWLSSQGVKGYKLWCLEDGEGKCIISRDVTFDEQTIAMKSPLKEKSINVQEKFDSVIEFDPISSTSKKAPEHTNEESSSQVEIVETETSKLKMKLKTCNLIVLQGINA